MAEDIKETVEKVEAEVVEEAKKAEAAVADGAKKAEAAVESEARKVAVEGATGGLVDITSLVMLAILLAAALILNMTVGNALATIGIKPQFVIAAYCLTIILTKASFAQALIYGLIAAAVTQLSTSIPGLNFLTEAAGALVMALFVKTQIKAGGVSVTPLVGTFVATFVSGALFAIIGTVIMGAEVGTAIVKLPIVLGTSVFNAVVVQALYIPLRKVLNK